QAATPLDIVLKVLEQEPVPPRNLDRRVDRDLETICLKCLAKDPAKRYSSAYALVEDLDRWLHGEPIHARPASGQERLWRWCRRNPMVAGLTAAVVLLLMAGTVVSSYLGIKATRAADLAERKAEEADDEALEAQRLASEEKKAREAASIS